MADKIKRYKSKTHVTINNSIMKEKDVSLKAKGLFALVMSLPDNWDFSIKGLCTISKENYTAINNAIIELIRAGYCRRERVKENGKFVGCDYEFSEVKMGGSPRLDFLNVENPNVENLKNNNINSTINSPLNDKNNNRESLLKTHFQKPKIEDIEAYIKEKGMHFDANDFYDHYEAVGWMVGRNHMKDWKAACRTWENKRKSKSQEEEITKEEPMPAGMTHEDWEKCEKWLRQCTPRICGYITPSVYMSMKQLANDGRTMAKIILYIERSSYSGDILSEFKSLLESGEYKEDV